MGPEMSNQHPTWALAIGCLVVTLALEAAFLVLLGRSTVDVDESACVRARSHCRPVTSVAPARSTQPPPIACSGPDCGPTRELSLRPWIKTAVQIEVDDMNDTTPYWVVATRRPSELVAALEFVRYAKAEL